MPRALDLFVELSWKCAAPACEFTARRGFMAPVDGPFETQPPDEWTLAGGRAYCHKHRIELVVSPRGAQVIEFPLKDLPL